MFYLLLGKTFEKTSKHYWRARLLIIEIFILFINRYKTKNICIIWYAQYVILYDKKYKLII